MGSIVVVITIMPAVAIVVAVVLVVPIVVAVIAGMIAIAIVVAVFYGLGFLFAALLILIPAIVAISLFPVLSPFILIGLAIYWFWWKRRKDARKSEPT